jgi:hypothetical protein
MIIQSNQCIHSQVNDPTCISRLAAFSEDAERLVNLIVPTHVLKINNLRFYPIEKQFKGACTCPLDFRADRQTTITHGDELPNASDQTTAASVTAEVPSNTPTYVITILQTFFSRLIHSTTIADVLDRIVTDGEYKLLASVKKVSCLFLGKRRY